MTVRSATLDDFDEWFALREAVAEEHRYIGAEPPLDRAANLAMFTASVTDDDKHTWVAVDDAGRIVGALGGWFEHGIVHLGMWVDRTERGRGVGRALLDACITWSKAIGAHKVALEAWPHNEAALRLYRAAGFDEEGRLRRQWRRRDGSLWDAITMGLVLDEDAPGSPYPDA